MTTIPVSPQAPRSGELVSPATATGFSGWGVATPPEDRPPTVSVAVPPELLGAYRSLADSVETWAVCEHVGDSDRRTLLDGIMMQIAVLKVRDDRRESPS